MTVIPPWANGPFELLVHAEGHLREGDDFDRRIALISFDNAIEVAITTYLTLHPIQRGNRKYDNPKVKQWLENYHTKLDFLEEEIALRAVPRLVDKPNIVWAHAHRNSQYHGGHQGAPEKAVLKIARDAAIWVFSLLFDVANAEAALDKAILDRAPSAAPSPERHFDVAIDAQYGIVEVGEQLYYASELLFAVDHAAYSDLGGRLCGTAPQAKPETDGEEQP